MYQEKEVSNQRESEDEEVFAQKFDRSLMPKCKEVRLENAYTRLVTVNHNVNCAYASPEFEVAKTYTHTPNAILTK